MGSYISSTLKEREEMLRAIGMKSTDELYSMVPDEALLKRPLDIPEGMSELEVKRNMEEIASKNKVFPHIFRGAGAYNHYIPSIVKYIPAKEEFLTSYTPYQAEISQGVLQAIFEYQTEMSELMGLPVCNASVYDGGTAAGEAAGMCRERKRTKTLISGSTHPDTIEVIKTYCWGVNCDYEIIPTKDGVTDIEAMKSMIDDTVASVFVQSPNFFGLFEDCDSVVNSAHELGAKAILSCNPIALGIMKSPGEYGADVGVAEGQPLGMSLAFGGPYLGIMTCSEKMMRKIPGRIVGQTVDADGNRCFVLTLQAREQHIRREKASSNICSNQALCALTATVYMAAMGPAGLANVAEQCTSKAHYMASELCKINGFEMKFGSEFFHEFVTTSPVPTDELMAKLEAKGILGGLPIEVEGKPCVLWCVTEMNSKQDIDLLIESVKEVAAR
ncbi:MAG: aminomethyl-transferring glycine dehydrogenase subunit GcvPA [Synergistaceae bacterium]